ncbi:MAG: hypothetical protein AAF065_13345 [Verrucomicrobiota bacterium]
MSLCYQQKNILFIGSTEAGCQRSAIIYSITTFCERHEIDLLSYMRDVLGQVAELGKNCSQIDHLLPSDSSPSAS